MNGKGWTEVEKAQLREMAELHIRVPFIARSLGRTVPAVLYQAREMGLPVTWKDRESEMAHEE